MSTSRRITFVVPNRLRITDVHAAVQPVLDENAIVKNVGGTGHDLWFRVTFANEAEVDTISRDAWYAALHVTSCDMIVR